MADIGEKYINPFTETAEISRFTSDQIRSYEDSLKYYRDLKNSLDTAREDGKEEGREEGLQEGRMHEKMELAKKALLKGFTVDDVSELTGLSKEQIETIK